MFNQNSYISFFRYYTKESLVGDQDYGPILSSLLVGPCALEFTKVRSDRQLWHDIPANELVQRHKISSCGSSTSLGSSSTQSLASPRLKEADTNGHQTAVRRLIFLEHHQLTWVLMAGIHQLDS